MPKLPITLKGAPKLKFINKVDSKFKYDSNMSGFSDLDDGINFNSLVIYLVSFFQTQRDHHFLTLFHDFHGHMTTSTDFLSHILCVAIVSLSPFSRTSHR